MSFRIPSPFGNINIPTPGDAFNNAEAMVGNLVEGVIEATTGEQVELTPGNGIDNSRVKGPRGTGEIQFDKKMASHNEVESLRKEIQSRLRALNRDVTKLRVQVAANQQIVPRPTMPIVQQPPQQGGGLAQMLPLLLLSHGDDIASNPAALLMMGQALQGSSIGSVGGQPIQVDLTTIALFSTLFGSFGKKDPPMARKVAPVVEAPVAPAGGPV